jgi:hypothetical protein
MNGACDAQRPNIMQYKLQSSFNSVTYRFHAQKNVSGMDIQKEIVFRCSHFSGITLMGVPAEVYYHGAIYWLVNVSSVIVAVIINYIYLPIFYNLQLTSSYEVSYNCQRSKYVKQK